MQLERLERAKQHRAAAQMHANLPRLARLLDYLCVGMAVSALDAGLTDLRALLSATGVLTCRVTFHEDSKGLLVDPAEAAVALAVTKQVRPVPPATGPVAVHPASDAAPGAPGASCESGPMPRGCGYSAHCRRRPPVRLRLRIAMDAAVPLRTPAVPGLDPAWMSGLGQASAEEATLQPQRLCGGGSITSSFAAVVAVKLRIPRE